MRCGAEQKQRDVCLIQICSDEEVTKFHYPLFERADRTGRFLA
jgi:hypothetical protein